MSDIGDEEMCELVCSQTLDGYYPNPMYSSGFCPDYMKSECNVDGTMWQKQWDKHQENLKTFTAEKVFHASMGVPTQTMGYQYQLKPRQQYASILPPTSSQVFATMRRNYPDKFQQPQSELETNGSRNNRPWPQS